MSGARVLVVGGGPVGLTAALRLAQEDVRSLVVERRRSVRRAPAAHVLRAAPMAVFERLGVADEIERAKPDLALDAITWCATLGGREIGRLDLRKGAPPGRDVWTNCPQNVLEPILRRAAARDDRIALRTGTECVAIESDEEVVRATLRAPDGSDELVETAWGIAADGAASPVRRMLGVPMVGPGAQGRFFMVHFEADLRPWLEGRSGPIFWILNPEASGALIVHDPARSHVWMTLRGGAPDEETTLPARLARSLGIPVEPRIVSVDGWAPHVQVAERYREGRVFLAGDAAHRFPPTGGLGLNTGVLDVDVLCGLLGEVERGGAGPDRLDAYEAACRPAAEANAQASLANALRLGEVAAAIGPCADLAALEHRLDTLDAGERARLDAAIERQRSHFVSDGRLPDAIGVSSGRPRHDIEETPMIELYHFGFSTCSQKVRLVLAEKELDFTSREVDLMNGGQHDPDYVKLNPNHVVPTLVHDGHVLLESSLIIQYLDDAFPEPPLRPSDAYGRYEVDRWIKHVDAKLHPAAPVVTFALGPRAMLMQQPEEVREANIAAIPDERARAIRRSVIEHGVKAPEFEGAFGVFLDTLDGMEDALADRDWLSGDRFGLADASLLPYVLRLEHSGMDPVLAETVRPRVADWLARVKARDTYGVAVDAWAPAAVVEMLRTNGKAAWDDVRPIARL